MQTNSGRAVRGRDGDSESLDLVFKGSGAVASGREVGVDEGTRGGEEEG